MSDKSITEKAREIALPIAKDLGYELVEVSFKKEYSTMALNFCLDKVGGITLEDCEKFSKALDEPLDKFDITNGISYNLNVSSYGLDRGLKTDYDFNKFLGEEIIVKFYKPFNGKKEIICRLKSFDDLSITVELLDKKEVSNNILVISKKDCSKIMANIKF